MFMWSFGLLIQLAREKMGSFFGTVYRATWRVRSLAS